MAASYDTSCFSLVNSISYIAGLIGAVHVPIMTGKMDGVSCAVCTSGEWGIRLRFISLHCFCLDVVSFSRKIIEHILSFDPEQHPDACLASFTKYFHGMAAYCDTDTGSISYLETQYREFPVRKLFQALNVSRNHMLDGQDMDEPWMGAQTVFTAASRRFA